MEIEPAHIDFKIFLIHRPKAVSIIGNLKNMNESSEYREFSFLKKYVK